MSTIQGGAVQQAQQIEISRILRDTGVQAKLTIGQPNDKYEQEADRVADQVMAIPYPKLQRKPENEKEGETFQSKPLVEQITPLLQRQEEPPGEEEEELQAKSKASEIPAVTSNLLSRVNSMKGSGQPLDSSTRAFFEPRFEHNFNHVRVHTDSSAADSATSIKARAFTVGNHVVMGSGAYQPQSSEGRRLLGHELTHVVQQNSGTIVQRKDDDGDEGMPFVEELVKAVTQNPKLMALQAKDIANEISQVLAEKEPGDSYFEDLYKVYWGFYRLIAELKRMPERATTTTEQRDKAEKLAEKWANIRSCMIADAERRMRRELAKAEKGARAMRVQLLYAYHDIYEAGEEPGDVKFGSLDTVKGVAEKMTDLLKAINEADAGITGRSVTPIIPVLDKTLTVVNVISGWKVTASLAAESSKGIAALQNAWSLANAGLGLAGFGKFLPLFGHIGPLLDSIAKGWDRVDSALRKKNRLWWEARDVMGEDLPHREAEPGGGVLHSYMKKMFRTSKPLSEPPSKDVLKFFYDKREMFNTAVKDVMGEPWSEVPTKSAWLISEETDPKKINRWVFCNRDMVWRLVYGRDMDPPKRRPEG